MARRKQSGLDLVASLPWPMGVVLGVVGYLVIRYGIGAYFMGAGGPLMQGVGQNLASGALAPLAWVVLFACWIAAAASFVSRRKRQRLVEVQSDLASLASLSWREFEMLVGEAFRRQGYE